MLQDKHADWLHLWPGLGDDKRGGWGYATLVILVSDQPDVTVFAPVWSPAANNKGTSATKTMLGIISSATMYSSI